MRKIQGKVEKICSRLISLLCSIFLLAAIVVVVLSHSGTIGLRVVQSGSMEPHLPVGSLLVTKKILPSKILKDDIISFSTSTDDTVAHRVVNIKGTNDEIMFQTKGDKNRSMDPQLVPETAVLGKVVFHIPFLGYIFQFLQRPASLFLTFFIILFIWILIKLIGIVRNMKSEERII
ncbi:signal peptidase I [Ligilactobacillus acidipiscis]|uniref:signal peptidase I n=1 Tax=Ligilactobacillus acidipiscis TaxID=89059 RepID=UPI0023F72F17|nr:signal peptidase I [Ligilactobacillus acidipiscis]WEV57015.1 signal peptidase I [Ligilactobacillus acidipiscis]